MAIKTSKQLERHFKGIANHYRIDILLLLDKSPNQSLIDLTEQIGANYKTLSEHTHRLVKAGLLNKKYYGTEVGHTLSPYGQKIVKLIKSF